MAWLLSDAQYKITADRYALTAKKGAGTPMTIYFPATIESFKAPGDTVAFEALLGDGKNS